MSDVNDNKKLKGRSSSMPNMADPKSTGNKVDRKISSGAKLGDNNSDEKFFGTGRTGRVAVTNGGERGESKIRNIIRRLCTSKPPKKRKIHGLHGCPNGYQIAMVIIYGIHAGSFLFFLYPGHAMQPLQITVLLIYMTGSVLLIAFVIFYLMASRVDVSPLTVRALPIQRTVPIFRRDIHEHVIDKLQYCNLCQVVVPNYTKHCKICNKCIWNYDHHCVWLNTCVSETQNFWPFVALLLDTSIGLALFTVSYALLYLKKLPYDVDKIMMDLPKDMTVGDLYIVIASLGLFSILQSAVIWLFTIFYTITRASIMCPMKELTPDKK